MVSEKFRRELRQEAEQWWSEGLIDADFYEKLAQRYQLQALERESSNRFIAILIGLGVILLGLGVITFVAANWQSLSRLVKVIVLMGCFLSVNVVGFYLWQQPQTKGFRRLGHGLLLLGGLLVGANLALMAQLFHESGEISELFLIWGLGVTAMSYSLRLTNLGVLSLILLAISYFSGTSFLLNQDFSVTHLILQHLPLVISLVFLPLAYWCRSGAIFTLSAILLVYSLVFIGSSSNQPIFAFVLPTALACGYGNLAKPNTLTASFGSIARRLALITLGILFYIFSFRSSSYYWETTPSFEKIWLLLDSIILSAVALLCWVRMGNPFQMQTFREGWINKATIALALIIITGMFFRQHDFFAVLIFNILLFLLALGLLRDGLALGNRTAFWSGMILLALGIISRTLEYDHDLLLKAFVFILSGLGIILAGFRFEQKLKPSSSLSQLSQEEPK